MERPLRGGWAGGPDHQVRQRRQAAAGSFHASRQGLDVRDACRLPARLHARPSPQQTGCLPVVPWPLVQCKLCIGSMALASLTALGRCCTPSWSAKLVLRQPVVTQSGRKQQRMPFRLHASAQLAQQAPALQGLLHCQPRVFCRHAGVKVLQGNPYLTSNLEP